MARGSNSDRMQLLRIREDRSLTHQALEAVLAKEVGEAFKIVVTKLIDDDSNDQLRSRQRSRVAGGNRRQDNE